MATIQERKGKTGTTYRVGYYREGKFAYTPTLADRAGAERIKAIIEKQGPDVALRLLRASQSGGLTLEEFFTRYLSVKAIRATDGTIAGYEREAARTWMPRLGEMPLSAITREAVTEWVSWQSQQPTARSVAARERATLTGLKGKGLPALVKVSPKTVRNAHSLLSSVLAFAHQEGIIDRNPAHGVPVPRDAVEEEREIFTREEWARFYAAMQPELQPLTAFLLVTGCRIGEATAVQVRDLNVTAGSVSILRAWKKARAGQELGTPKSRRSRRVILLPEWAVKVFAQAAQGKGPEDLLFTAPGGGRIVGARYGARQWKAALVRAGIGKHLTPHSARHTFASWALMDGVAPQTVQHRLGHESLATTSKVYAHLLLEAQGAAVNAIGWEPAGELEAQQLDSTHAVENASG